jgi:ubiquinone/menaquinone biosynthesis C-methylase UbiE
MFDDFQNRQRLNFRSKVKVCLILIRENGISFFLLLIPYYLSSSLATRLLNILARIRQVKGVPGINSARLNKEIWENWDWKAAGDEWTPSLAWKESIVRSILRPNIAVGSDVLEIGPGAGRWTEYLLPSARSYVGIDISAKCVWICQERFNQYVTAKFVSNSGADLAALSDRSIDRIWSFDTFVHINRAEVAKYVKEMKRVMRSGALGIIHHGDHGGRGGGWRSDLSSETFSQLLQASGLRIESQFSQWSDATTGERHALAFEDKITVFRMPD